MNAEDNTANGGGRGGGAPGRIVSRREGDVFVMGIDRPEKYNGFSPNMFDELATTYQAYEDDDGARCALLYGEGKHFAIHSLAVTEVSATGAESARMISQPRPGLAH